MPRCRGSGSPCDRSRAALPALAGLRLGSHRGCYRVGLGIAPSLWAAQASPSLLGGVVGLCDQTRVGDASSECQTALVAAPAGSTSGLLLRSCEPGEGRRLVVPPGFQEAAPPTRLSPARHCGGGCGSAPSGTVPPPRQLRPVEPGESPQCREPPPQPLHDSHQRHNEASEPPLSIPLEVRSFVSKAGRRSLQTHSPHPSTAVAHPPPPRPGGTPVHCSDPSSSPQRKPSRPRPPQEANTSWLLQKPPLSRHVPSFCVLTQAIPLSRVSPSLRRRPYPEAAWPSLQCCYTLPFLGVGRMRRMAGLLKGLKSKAF